MSTVTAPGIRWLAKWLDRVDPGTHRRIKGLRLVTAYGIAAMMGYLPVLTRHAPGPTLSALAGAFALWASVSEAQTTRLRSSRDLAALCAAAVAGALVVIALTPLLTGPGRPGAELTLATGAFLVGYLRRFGILGTGIGSQIYIGQLTAYGAALTAPDIPAILIAGIIAAVAAIVPRLLSGPAEHPALAPTQTPLGLRPPAELRMGLQAAIGALIIVALHNAFPLQESVWAITACTYVVAATSAGTLDRVRRRILGTLVGVPIGLACLPIAAEAPLLIWAAAALAMVIYAMALPERYDIACGAFAFTLIVTLELTGDTAISTLAARAWETLIGGALGLAAALLILPIRSAQTNTPAIPPAG